MSDSIIINQIRSGDHSKAFYRLYKGFSAVRKYVVQNSGTTDDAKDIFQDALIVLNEKVKQPDFELSANLTTYLFAIAKNKWLCELRKRNRPLPEIQEEHLNEEQEEKFLLAEKALLKIGEKCQEILISFYVAKKTMEEIAKKFGFSGERSAKNQKYKCLEKAREIYRTL